MTYQEELIALLQLEPKVKRALQKAAFNIREGTADQQLLYDAVFSNTTKFTAYEATLLAWHYSWGDNDLSILGSTASDAQIQVCVDAILGNLITIQTTRTTITGL